MHILCKLGLHRWFYKATYRPGTVVRRCLRCNKKVVRHNMAMRVRPERQN